MSYKRHKSMIMIQWQINIFALRMTILPVLLHRTRNIIVYNLCPASCLLDDVYYEEINSVSCKLQVYKESTLFPDSLVQDSVTYTVFSDMNFSIFLSSLKHIVFSWTKGIFAITNFLLQQLQCKYELNFTKINSLILSMG